MSEKFDFVDDFTIDSLNDEEETTIHFDEKGVIFENYNKDVINDPNTYGFKNGELIHVIQDNIRKRCYITEVHNTGINITTIMDSLCCDIYVFSENINEFILRCERVDPEDILEDEYFSDGTIVKLTKCGTNEPLIEPGSNFVDPTGIYIITESMDSYIEEYNNIYDSGDEPYDEDEEEDEVDTFETLMFVPIKSFFYYLKDKRVFIDMAKHVFNKLESGEEIHTSFK